MSLLNSVGAWCFVFTPDVRCVVTLHGELMIVTVNCLYRALVKKTFETGLFSSIILQCLLTESTYLTAHTYVR